MILKSRSSGPVQGLGASDPIPSSQWLGSGNRVIEAIPSWTRMMILKSRSSGPVQGLGASGPIPSSQWLGSGNRVPETTNEAGPL